jgi:hypothetical protein
MKTRMTKSDYNPDENSDDNPDDNTDDIPDGKHTTNEMTTQIAA